MELMVVQIEKPEAVNLILGQSHFIKTVEDLYETLVGAVPGIKFGLAFCESSGPALVRASGTDDGLVELAERNAMALSAGHSFIIFLGEGFYPVNVLNAVKMVPEVCHIFCATANPVEVILAETDETDPGGRKGIVRAVVQDVRDALDCGVHHVGLLPHMALLKSTSGKISRSANQARYMADLETNNPEGTMTAEDGP